MFPVNRQPIPVYIEYTVRGKRVRKWFASQVESRSFYLAKDQAGAKPAVIRIGERLPEIPK